MCVGFNFQTGAAFQAGLSYKAGGQVIKLAPVLVSGYENKGNEIVGNKTTANNIGALFGQ